MKSIVSSKRQITRPAEVRGRLGRAAGTPVHFEFTTGGVLLRKGGVSSHPVDEVLGVLKLTKPVDALIDEMRGPRPKAKSRKRDVRRPTRERRPGPPA